MRSLAQAQSVLGYLIFFFRLFGMDYHAWVRPRVCKMSALICSSSSASTGAPSSTAARPNFERLLTTAGPSFGFLIINTLHMTMIFGGAMELTLSYSILFYSASLLIGGFLSDYFNSWILFLFTVEISSVLTTILSALLNSGNHGVIVFFMFLAFDVTAWLAAAKYIKNCTISPTQQRLWWTLLTACSSINVPLMILERWQVFWYVIGLGTLLLLILIAVGYVTYDKQLTRNHNDQEVCKVTLKQLPQVFFVKSYNFWSIVVLNTLLLATKWVITLMILPLKDEKVVTVEGMHSYINCMVIINIVN